MYCPEVSPVSSMSACWIPTVRKPIEDFLGEWEIKAIIFSGVTLEHLITGEAETYAVEYKPVKHLKDSAQAGYGQGSFARRNQSPICQNHHTVQIRPTESHDPGGAIRGWPR